MGGSTKMAPVLCEGSASFSPCPAEAISDGSEDDGHAAWPSLGQLETLVTPLC